MLTKTLKDRSTPKGKTASTNINRSTRGSDKGNQPSSPKVTAEYIMTPPDKGCIIFMHINTRGINPRGGICRI